MINTCVSCYISFEGVLGNSFKMARVKCGSCLVISRCTSPKLKLMLRCDLLDSVWPTLIQVSVHGPFSLCPSWCSKLTVVLLMTTCSCMSIVVDVIALVIAIATVPTTWGQRDSHQCRDAHWSVFSQNSNPAGAGHSVQGGGSNLEVAAGWQRVAQGGIITFGDQGSSSTR